MTKHDLSTELRAAREARGMSLDDIAQSTLINVDFLKAIEAGDTNLPAAYVRAFLRAYASSVGLDPAYVMRRFEGKTGNPNLLRLQHPSGRRPRLMPNRQPRPSFSRPGVRTVGCDGRRSPRRWAFT